MARELEDNNDKEDAIILTGNGSHVLGVVPIGYARSRGCRGRRGGDSPRALVRNFMDYTSSHGFAHINRVENTGGRTVWSVLTLAGISMAMYQAYSVIDQYLHYEYNTLMDIKFDANVTFPMVTICNINPYR